MTKQAQTECPPKALPRCKPLGSPSLKRSFQLLVSMAALLSSSLTLAGPPRGKTHSAKTKGWAHQLVNKGARKTQRLRLPLQDKAGKQIAVKLITSQWMRYHTNDKGAFTQPKEHARIRVKGNLVIGQFSVPYADGKGTMVDQKIMRFRPNQAKRLTRNGMLAAYGRAMRDPAVGRFITFDEVVGRLALEHTVQAAATMHYRRDQIKTKDLYAGAVAGMVAQLPDHFSCTVHPDDAKQSQQSMSGNTVGIGIAMTARPIDKQAKPWRKNQRLPANTPATVTIVKTVDHAPAGKAGLKAGDILLEANGKPITSLKAAGDLISGTAGTDVKLTIRRNNRKRTITVTRDHYDPNPVVTKLENGVAYVKLPSFDKQALSKVKTAIETMGAKRKSGLKGVVLDFRGNPGGELNNALGITNLFAAEGTLLEMKGFRGEHATTVKADPKAAPFAKLPLVFLVDGHSYSASELTAGSLQDLGRATIIGTKTGGKGTRMSVLQLPNGGRLALIDAQYFYASGASPQDTGLRPDISRRSARRHNIKRGAAKDSDHVLDEAMFLLKNGKIPVQRQPRPAVSAAPVKGETQP